MYKYMSAKNQQRNIQWKGQTFNQIVAGLKMNTRTFSTSSTREFFIAPPLKHYRKELGECDQGYAGLGDAFLQPGGTVTNTASSQSLPYYTIDFNQSVIKSNNPDSLCDRVACSKQADARRLLRSSGKSNNTKYFTSTNQYLNSRTRTVKQNEYNFVRTGDPSYKPGSPNSIPNVYRGSGLSSCPKFHLYSNPLFQYQWLDGVVYNFSMAPGYYDLGELNDEFYKVLIARGQYYNDIQTGSKVFLFKFVYNTLADTVQLQCFATNTSAEFFPTARYTVPVGATWVTPAYTIVPQIRVLSNELQTGLGIVAGNYPAADISGNTSGQRDQTQPAIRISGAVGAQFNIYHDSNGAAYDTLYNNPNGIRGNQFFTGSVKPKLGSPYVPLYYKPSNSKFANQGGVDSSARLQRLKYDTVTNSANTFMSAYGRATADALAYGVPGPGYTLKTKTGYSQPLAPTFKNGSVQNCPVNHIRGG
jgi:hypothetical protein